MAVLERHRDRDANLEEGFLSAIRALSRAVDSHSRRLRDQCGLTLPQVVVLRRLSTANDMTAGALSRAVGLGQPSTKVIVDSLVRRGLVTRAKDCRDRRTVRVAITAEGCALAQSAPSLLSDAFWHRVGALEDWERTQMLSSIQRLASMMVTLEPNAASARFTKEVQEKI